MAQGNRTGRDPGSPLIPHGALRCAAFDEFIGAVRISECFAIDGREEDYFWVWEAPLPAAPFWRSREGYAIYALGDEYEPETLVLVSPEGERCGFNMEIELWIEPAHRGRGLGAELVLAMTERLGRSPRAGQEAMGFSLAGYRAHFAAWRLAHQRAAALEREREVPSL